MSKFFNLIILLILAYIFYCVQDFANNSAITAELTPESARIAELYDYSQLTKPEQKSYESNDQNIVMENDNYKVALFPKAKYRIYAMVMSKKKYTWGWDGDVYPYDLVLAWDKLILPENRKGIVYAQGSRWYYFYYDDTFPLSKKEVYKYSSNNHIIPANERILEATEKIRNKEKIYLEGFLVNIKGKSEGKDVFFKYESRA